MATDNFDRADATDLGAAWGTVLADSLEVVANVARAVNIFNPSGNRRIAETYNANQSSQAKLLAASASWRYVGVTVRTSAGGDFYAGGIENFDLASQRYRIWKRISGVSTNIILHGSMNAAANDVVKLSITGTSLSLVVNSVEILTATDSDISGPGAPGIIGYSSSSNNAWDDWVGSGDGGGGSTLTHGRRIYILP